jgi:hypothetical protein
VWHHGGFGCGDMDRQHLRRGPLLCPPREKHHRARKTGT